MKLKFTVIFVKSFRELMNLRRHFKSLEEDSFLSLESNVSRPSDKTSEIFLVLDITTNSEVSGGRFEQGIFLLFDLLGGFNDFLGSFRLFKTNISMRKTKNMPLPFLSL